MRILNLVAGEKWTGPAAVVFDQTSALVNAGVEAQFAFVRDSPLAERLANIGWARPLFERPPRLPHSYLRDLQRLRETILREKFDIVHAHTSHDHHIAALAMGRTRVPLLRTLHHLRHARPRLAEKVVYARTRGFAFANSEIADEFPGGGPVHSPVVDTDRFHPGPKPLPTLRRFGLPEGRFLVGTIGKMAAGRGHEEAIQAVARSEESIDAVHVGHGETMPRLKKLAASLRTGDRNFWTGYQESLLPDLYRCWDAFLFTASGSQQGQRAILEAMASGVPVVALDLPGVGDLMTDGKEGFIAGAVKELPERLGRLTKSPELRTQMAERARNRALEFTGPKFVEKTLPFYKRFATAGARK